MSSYTQEREQVQVIGTVQGAVQKSAENFQIQVVPDGGTNPKNLWTKDQQMVVPYCMSQIGNRLAFLCNVSHWERGGQQVTSLWIEQVGPPAVGSPALAGPPMAQPMAQPQPAAQAFPPPAQPQPVVVQPQVQPMQAPVVQQDDREGKIHRQTAAKVASTLLGYLPEGERNLATLFVISERLVAYFNTGLAQAENLDQLMARAMPRSMDDTHGGSHGGYDAAAAGQGYANTPPPPGDDDIPF
jgi:type IV secretory pathway VirB10-like protein